MSRRLSFLVLKKGRRKKNGFFRIPIVFKHIDESDKIFETLNFRKLPGRFYYDVQLTVFINAVQLKDKTTVFLIGNTLRISKSKL